MSQRVESADASDVQRRFSYWKRRAQHGPVIVRHHGQDEVVLISADEFARLKRRDREALRAEDFSDEDLKAIAAAHVPPEFAHLDDELDDPSR